MTTEKSPTESFGDDKEESFGDDKEEIPAKTMRGRAPPFGDDGRGQCGDDGECENHGSYSCLCPANCID